MNLFLIYFARFLTGVIGCALIWIIVGSREEIDYDDDKDIE